MSEKKKNRQHNGQQKKYKRTNNDPQNIDIKQKIELKTGGELMCFGRVSSPPPQVTPVVLI